jgi:glycerophosphoryl diester phosphodiesterase
MKTAWPYPTWIAHRGAGKLAPENTLAAFKLGAAHGYRMFECDAKLSADEKVFLLHDETLERTTNGQGIAGHLNWQALCGLDAGSWHSPQYAGEPLPLLADIADFCIANNFYLNIEIKPSTGVERRTGECVADLAQQLWKQHPIPPLLTSFKAESLRGAQSVAPQIPRGLLVDAWHDEVFTLTHELQCVALVCNHRIWTRERVTQAHQRALKCLSYTVNEADDVSRLKGLGTDAFITDRVDAFKP